MVLQLFSARKPDPTETKASAAAPVVAFHGSGRAQWSARDTTSLIKNGFVNNPVGFRCVKMIAEAAAAVPIIVQDCDRRYEEHPLISILNRPNGAQSGADLLESFFGQLLLTGDGYFEAAGEDVKGHPQELFVLRSDRMRVVPGPDGWPVAYEYVVGARKHRFDMSKEFAPILHVKNFHPQDDHYGLSPMLAAAQALDVHNSQWRRINMIVWSTSWRAIIRARAMRVGQCFWKGGWTGNRWVSRPLTWNFRKPKKVQHARLHWPLVCRQCCLGFLVMRRIRII